MKALTVTDDYSLEVSEIEQPALGTGHVRLAVQFAGVCGTDLHLLQAPDHSYSGKVLGHEFGGVITEIGQDVTGDWSVGDRVAVMPVEACGNCPPCYQGGICITGLERTPGAGIPGGFAEYADVPAGMLHRLSSSISDEGAAVAEPLAVAVRSVNLSNWAPGEAICVLGAGPVGFMTVVAAKARGIEQITVIDPNRERLSKVARLGVDTSTSPEELSDPRGAPPAVVIDTSGHPSGIASGIELLAPMGRLVVVGIPIEPVPTDYLMVVTKELTVVGSFVYTRNDYVEALRYLADGLVPVDDIVTARVGLESGPSIVRDLASGSSSHIKVLFSPHSQTNERE